MANVDKLVTKKNQLVKELSEVLNKLEDERVDLLCDAVLRGAVKNHIALDLKNLTIIK